MKKEKIISDLKPIFENSAIIFVYFIVKTDSGLMVKKANLNSNDAIGIIQSLKDEFSKKVAELEELDKDFGSLKQAISKSDGILLYDLDKEPQTFTFVREVEQHHHNIEDDYFSLDNGRLFMGKESLKSIDGFIISLTYENKTVYITGKIIQLIFCLKKRVFGEVKMVNSNLWKANS